MSKIIETKTVHKGWTTLRVVGVELSNGEVIHREIEDHGRATSILPYDPDRKIALLVRQYRAPVDFVARHESLLEAVAGLLEGEDPAACARREALEEVGLRLTSLEHVATVWTMPGISTEIMDLYLASYSERDRIARGGGNSDEHEDIIPTEISLDEVVGMADRGELNDMKTMLLVQTLRLRHPELFESPQS
jgi:nudix-type nucleoside diphosphatase (YffH/AdpP family)